MKTAKSWTWWTWRRVWMLAGFCSAWFIGDYFLAVRAAPRGSAEFLVDLAWTCWLLMLVVFFTICLNVDAFSFDPWVTATQKALIVSFAVWAEWLAWQAR